MKKLVIFSIIVMLLLSGCGAKVPMLTEDEGALIAEYAVGNLMKYQKNSGSRLVDTKAMEETMQQTEDVSEESPEIKEPATEEMTNDAEIIEIAETPKFKDISSFLQLAGIEIQYSGYEVTNVYPQEENSFSVQASMGKTLLVSKFTLTNRSEQEESLDLLAKDIKSRVAINGNNTYRALTTMLLDDFSTFQGTILPGESKSLVVLIEMPKEQEELLETVIMTMKAQDRSIDIDCMK